MLDASALLDVLVGTEVASAVVRRIEGLVWHAPAHLDAEVLSALGRVARAGELSAADVTSRLELLARMRLTRNPVAPLLLGAWARRGDLRLVDALHVELADQPDAHLITTDHRLARATPPAEAVTP